MIRPYSTGKEEVICTSLRPGEKLCKELLLDKENGKASERDRIYVVRQEEYDWDHRRKHSGAP